MKNNTRNICILLATAIFSLIFSACTESQCYREHLKVYTEDYVAICEDGYWKDYCAAAPCDYSEQYSFDDHEITNILNRLSEECPVIQCIDNNCKCTPKITREEVGFMQLEALIDELIGL